MLCVPSARHLFGTATLASSALSASAELLVLYEIRRKISFEMLKMYIALPPSLLSYAIEGFPNMCQKHFDTGDGGKSPKIWSGGD